MGVLSHIRWAWLPAAILSVTVLWHRQGPVIAGLAIAGGLAFGLYINHRARVRLTRGPDVKQPPTQSDHADGGDPD